MSCKFYEMVDSRMNDTNWLIKQYDINKLLENNFECNQEDNPCTESIIIYNQSLNPIVYGNYYVDKDANGYVCKLYDVSDKGNFATIEDAKEFLEFCLNHDNRKEFVLSGGMVITRKGMDNYSSRKNIYVQDDLRPFEKEDQEVLNILKRDREYRDELALVIRCNLSWWNGSVTAYFMQDRNNSYSFGIIPEALMDIDDFAFSGFHSVDSAVNSFTDRFINKKTTEETKVDHTKSSHEIIMEEKHETLVYSDTSAKKGFFAKLFGI